MLTPIELVDLLERYEKFLIHYAVGVFRLLGDAYPSIEARLISVIKGTAFPVPIDVFARHLERLSDPELLRRKATEGLLERSRLHRTLLSFIGDGVSPEMAERPLVDMAEKGEPSEQAFAVITLAGQGQAKARETLLAEFGSWSRILRWGTMIILDALGGVEWQPLFQANLEDAEPDVARVAIAAVGRTGTASATAKLQALLGHASEAIVIAAIQSLAQLRDPHAVPALKELARTTTNPRIRATVMSAFGEFPDASTMGPLVEALDNGDPRTRANAVLAIKRLHQSQGHQDEAIVKRLKARLEDHDHRVRADTAQALWELGHRDGLPVIGAMLKSPTEHDRISGAYLCGKLKLTQFSDHLTALTDDRSWNVRKTAALALLNLGPNGLLVLQTLMYHGTPDQQVCAAYATGLADDPDGVNALMTQSRSGTEMAEMATDLLLRMSRPGGEEAWVGKDADGGSSAPRLGPTDQFGPSVDRDQDLIRDDAFDRTPDSERSPADDVLSGEPRAVDDPLSQGIPPGSRPSGPGPGPLPSDVFGSRAGASTGDPPLPAAPEREAWPSEVVRRASPRRFSEDGSPPSADVESGPNLPIDPDLPVSER